MARSEQESALRHPLTHILGTDSNLRVLRCLVQHGGPLTATDVVRRTRLSRDGVNRALHSLNRSGIVETIGSAHTRVHRFVADHPLASALGGLYAAEAERFKAILAAIRGALSDGAVVSLFLYGSVARGEDGPDSDLDIGVIAEATALASAVETLREALRLLAERMGFVPNVVGLDLDDVRRMARDDDPWWRNVSTDAIVLAGRMPEEAATE